MLATRENRGFEIVQADLDDTSICTRLAEIRFSSSRAWDPSCVAEKCDVRKLAGNLFGRHGDHRVFVRVARETKTDAIIGLHWMTLEKSSGGEQGMH